MLVCDDEPQIVRALRVVLRDAGYEMLPAGTLAEALDVAASEAPDAAIVDIVLPDGSGVELCRRLRSWSGMPIVVLSAIDEEQQKVEALQAGADDYLTKPFSSRELIARLEVVFRRVEPAASQSTLLVRGLEINLPAHTVKLDGRELGLTPTEFELLGVLARNRGRLITSDALLREVWGPEHEHDTPLLRTHIANLRRKLDRRRSGAWSYISTEPGVGYRFAE